MHLTKQLIPQGKTQKKYLSLPHNPVAWKQLNYTTWVQILVNDMRYAEFQQAEDVHNAIKKHR
jgi:hypothetical protein